MTSMAASGSMSGQFPVDVEVDGPQPQNRLSVLLRILYAIPHVIVVALVGIVAELITIVAWLAIVFTGKYPVGMITFVEGYLHWATRVGGYYSLLTDKYPPFAMGADVSYPIRLSVQSQAEARNRVTVFFRIFMLIPHIIALYVLRIIGNIVMVISWIAALVTGSVPTGMHTFMAGLLRWQTRVGAYGLLLTDVYPPFSLT